MILQGENFCTKIVVLKNVKLKKQFGGQDFMYPVPRTLPIVSCLMLVLLGGAVSVASAASLCLEKGQVRLKQQFQLSGLHPDLTEEFCRRFKPEPSEVEIVRPRPPNAEDTPPTPAMSDLAPTVSNPTLSPVPLRDDVSVVKQDEEIPAPEPFASSLDNDTTVEDVLPSDLGITSSLAPPLSNTPDIQSSPEVSIDTPPSNISEPDLPEFPPTSPPIRNDRVDLSSAEKSSLFQGWGLGAAVTYTRTAYQEHQYAILMGGEGWELRGIQQQGNWLYGIAQSYASHQGSADFGDVRGPDLGAVDAGGGHGA